MLEIRWFWKSKISSIGSISSQMIRSFKNQFSRKNLLRIFGMKFKLSNFHIKAEKVAANVSSVKRLLNNKVIVWRECFTIFGLASESSSLIKSGIILLVVLDDVGLPDGVRTTEISGKHNGVNTSPQGCYNHQGQRRGPGQHGASAQEEGDGVGTSREACRIVVQPLPNEGS